MSNANNRKFFRVSDKIAMTVKAVSSSTTNIAELFEQRRKETGLANSFVQEKKINRPSLMSIERRFPDVVTYIETLENRLQLLTNNNGKDDKALPMQATHSVDLSASGISFFCSNKFVENSLVEISIRLFPSRIRIHTISTIIRCDASNKSHEYDVAARFTHIHEEDEEQLFQHIHKIQTDALKIVVN
ncbi:MAG TPA: hypothetical protein DD827_03295 [Gammaproteobacteria bacterium]|jgi:hypothetical protein|nr:hypothetical protein [Gammaproteobacteria bacterium]